MWPHPAQNLKLCFRCWDLALQQDDTKVRKFKKESKIKSIKLKIDSQVFVPKLTIHCFLRDFYNILNIVELWL